MRHLQIAGVALGLALLGVVFVAGDSVIAQAADMPAVVKQSKLATGTMIFTDGKGMTLYTYAKDADGVSNCNGQCATNWPPLAAAADAKPVGAWTIVTRMDGSKQWAYKNRALYTWIKDTKPGDTTGDGVGGAWKTAVP